MYYILYVIHYILYIPWHGSGNARIYVSGKIYQKLSWHAGRTTLVKSHFPCKPTVISYLKAQLNRTQSFRFEIRTHVQREAHTHIHAHSHSDSQLRSSRQLPSLGATMYFLRVPEQEDAYPFQSRKECTSFSSHFARRPSNPIVLISAPWNLVYTSIPVRRQPPSPPRHPILEPENPSRLTSALRTQHQTRTAESNLCCIVLCCALSLIHISEPTRPY